MCELRLTATLSDPAAVVPQVAQGVFIGALSALFVIARVYARISAFKRLFLDDYLVFLAWLMYLCSAILWQLYSGYLYEDELVSAGLEVPKPTIPQDTVIYLRASLVVIILFYTSLWLVKFSFLIFFRRLGDKVKGQKILWWTVFSIVLATWIVTTFGTPHYSCLVNDFGYLATQCSTPQAIKFDQQTLQYNMAIDVITDVLIMTIPVSILWNARIDLHRKLALFGIFSLTVLTMVFAIVRVAVISARSKEPDQSWLYMWSAIEQTISIIVVCLACFRVLFTKQDKPTRPRVTGGYTKQNGGTSRRGLLSTKGFKTWFASRNGKTHQESGPNLTYDHTLPKNFVAGPVASESRENIIPLQGIQITNSFIAASTQLGAKDHITSTSHGGQGEWQ